MRLGGGRAVPAASSFAVRIGVGIGLVSLVAGILLTPATAWPYLLLLSWGLIGLGLGAVSFVAFQYITGSGWSAVFRRVPEAMMAIVPIGAAGLAIVFLLHPTLYSWYGAPHGAHAGVSWFKNLWLNWPFFLARAAGYVVLWLGFSAALIRNSRKQDSGGDISRTRANIRLSAAFLAVFGITSYLASVDWIMSLEPEWYSTMFGWYNFAGMFVSAIAVIILITVWLMRRGPLQGIVNDTHLHDLGKLLFAFSTFWMYIWFSQYMLIWYSNIPEETVYFTTRIRGGWLGLSITSVLLNWGIPFVALLSQPVKRNAGFLAKVAIVVLAGRWLDLFIMVFPSQSPAGPQLGIWEAGMTIGAISVFLMVVFHAIGKANLLPTGDPYFQESLHHH